ncbi:MAG: 50S ribosomal protein L30e [Candidatus Aenigmarchaeota archaeon]|nr:50S ribosomal protein L30e [Candidatus Aenigmarchaeota archaeon]
MKFEDELKTAIEKNKVIIGNREAVKSLKIGKVKFIVLASNCPEEMKKDIEHYSKISKTELHVFGGTGKQLGVFCGKPFAIAILAVKK